MNRRGRVRGSGQRLGAALLGVAGLCVISGCRFGYEQMDEESRALLQGPQEVSAFAGASGSDGTDGVGGAGSKIGDEFVVEQDCERRDYEGHAYQFCLYPSSFSAAGALCREVGGLTVEIDSEGENAFVAQEASSLGLLERGGSFYTGGLSLGAEEPWQWSGLRAFWASGHSSGKYANWEQEPALELEGEACATVQANGRWLPSDCSTERSFVCELSSWEGEEE